MNVRLFLITTAVLVIGVAVVAAALDAPEAVVVSTSTQR